MSTAVESSTHECIFERVGISPGDVVTMKKIDSIRTWITWIIGIFFSVVMMVLVIMGLVLKSNVAASDRINKIMVTSARAEQEFEVHKATKDEQYSQLLSSLSAIQQDMTQQRTEVQEIRGAQDLILEHLLKNERRGLDSPR